MSILRVHYIFMSRSRSREKKIPQSSNQVKIENNQSQMDHVIQFNKERPTKLKNIQQIKKYHKFIRSSSEQSDEQQKPNKNQKNYVEEEVRRYYYQKLYKDFVIVDLSRYQIGQIGCRWRTEQEVIGSKGEDICGAVKCSEKAIFVFEMNFGYKQKQEKKNALVKVAVCKQCADKINFKKKLKLIKEIQKKVRQNNL